MKMNLTMFWFVHKWSNLIEKCVIYKVKCRSRHAWASVNTNFLFDCTNTSTHKVRFVTGSQGGSGNILGSNTDMNYTFFTFIRLGDT